jgi:hypothetical protein
MSRRFTPIIVLLESPTSSTVKRAAELATVEAVELRRRK